MTYPNDLLDRFTTPLALACEHGENSVDLREYIGAPCISSIVWINDAGEARYFESLHHLYNMFRVAIEAEEEGDYRPAVYEARGTIDAMEYHGVPDEMIRAFREILETIETGEA